MDETSKSKQYWGELEKSVFVGKGIDIGCGPDPVFPDVRCFDMQDGDANHITRYVDETFDFVYASHCLEHMHKPAEALLEWWQLVKVGGHLIFLVPDEDLYEQGVFPSRFNTDHKATFTISKSKSWSPVSINVLDLVKTLPNVEVVSVKLQDQGYDRSLYRHGLVANPLVQFGYRAHNAMKRRLGFQLPGMETLFRKWVTVDQTYHCGALAQIQCILKKLA